MRDQQGVVPMLSYEDGPRAMDWLRDAFGFVERVRMVGDDGALSHGEMDTGSGVVMMATPSTDYESPRRHREHCDAAKRVSAVPWILDGVLVYVDDVQSHLDRATDGGATILSSIEEDYPGRRYRAEDIEGHRWMFLEWPADASNDG